MLNLLSTSDFSYAGKQIEQFRRESIFQGENYVETKNYADHLGFIVA